MKLTVSCEVGDSSPIPQRVEPKPKVTPFYHCHHESINYTLVDDKFILGR